MTINAPLDQGRHGDALPGAITAGCRWRHAKLEAKAAGLAVVGPDSRGPATYLRDGRNGFLARTTSIPRLRAAIRRASGCAERGRLEGAA